MSKFIHVWCVVYLCVGPPVGHSLRSPRELSDDNQCNFDITRKIYKVTDLLRCIDELVIDRFSEDGSRSLRQRDQFDSSIRRINPYQFSYGNLISYLFDNDVATVQHDPISDYYQLNQPAAVHKPSIQHDGFRINLFDALSSISRYDDLKCVPRILCEAASGRLPGEYQRAYLDESGRNTFVQWLSGFDVAATSPVLNLARAAALGYGSRGNPTTCYRSFPRCPRNPEKLVHYLNNHNGGFFRFFNGGRGGYRRPQAQSLYALRDNSGNKGGAPPPGYGRAETDRTGTGELKFDIAAWTAREDDGKNIFYPKETIEESSRRVVFPAQEERSGDERPSAERRSPKSLSTSREIDASELSQKSSSFFPRESKDQDTGALRFPA